MNRKRGWEQVRVGPGPPVRELIRDGKWLVDPDTVHLAPPPREESRQKYAMIRSSRDFIGEVNR